MNQRTERLTIGQALVKFLSQQQVERDGVSRPFFAGCFGILGHGIIAGLGQALQQNPSLRFYQSRNEQAMVHTAVAYAKVKNRLQTMICTSSIGPGATNMVTGAALATINRLPVLLLPGDVFARRNVGPVLQQLESEHSQDISVNDCFKPVSRYWDRIYRADQLLTALPEVMRVLTSPSETGAVTLALPQDAQTEAWDFPADMFRPRVWRVPRNRPDTDLLKEATALIRGARRPMIVAGGGVHYSEATEALLRLVNRTGIPVAETMAGKGSLRFDHPLNLGAMGVTGTLAANRVARDADVVIGIGTRYSDFTTCSKTAFQNAGVRFININVAGLDACKHFGLPLTADARVTIEELDALLGEWSVSAEFRVDCEGLHRAWEAEVDRIYAVRHQPLPSQGELIGAVNQLGDPSAIMINAAGSMPGDLHKLWRCHHSKHFHLEYGYSCMGYEIAGGLGVKLAEPDREVYVMVGDGSYLMLGNEIVTSIQENQKLTIVLMDNSGFNSIGGLSRSLGQGGVGTRYMYPREGCLAGDEPGVQHRELPVDLAMNARGLGAHVIECDGYESFCNALDAAKKQTKTTVIYIRNDRYAGVGGYDSWWDVPPAEVSEMESVRAAREKWAAKRADERLFF